MALFHKRPLAAASFLLITVIFISLFAPLGAVQGVALLGAVSFLALLLPCFIKGLNYRRLCVALLALALTLGGVRVVFDRLQRSGLEACTLNNSICATYTVKDIYYTSSYGTEYLVEVRDTGGTRPYTAVLRADLALPFYIGDRFWGESEARELGFESTYENAVYSYLADGAQILLLVTSTDSLALVESGTDSFPARLRDLRAFLAHRISSACEGEEAEYGFVS